MYIARACSSMFCVTISATTTETGEPRAVPCSVYRWIENRLRTDKGAVGLQGRLWVMVVGRVIC